MARSSNQDPVEKFRFKITVISLGLNVKNIIETLGAAKNIPGLKAIARAGFSEVTLPRVNITEIPYRENLDAFRFRKLAGLTKFEPITFRRGVTPSRDLLYWYRDVNNDKLLQSIAQEFAGKTRPFNTQEEIYRKEVIIDVLDREGKIVKRWILFNAFPISYKGGDDLSADSEQKLIEELTLTYESFQELVVKDKSGKGQLGDLGKELAKDVIESVVKTELQNVSALGSAFNEDF